MGIFLMFPNFVVTPTHGSGARCTIHSPCSSRPGPSMTDEHESRDDEEARALLAEGILELPGEGVEPDVNVPEELWRPSE